MEVNVESLEKRLSSWQAELNNPYAARNTRQRAKEEIAEIKAKLKALKNARR